MKVNPSHTSHFFLALFVSFFAMSCQRTAPIEEEKTYQVIILLASERATLDDVELLKTETILKRNRNSRSQNQWQIDLKKKPSEMEEFLKKLGESTRVTFAKLSTSN